MDVTLPVSSILPKTTIALQPTDTVGKAKAIFDQNPSLHHIPVVEFHEVQGIVNKVDLCHFLKGSLNNLANQQALTAARLQIWRVSEIMKTNLFKLPGEATILQALQLFEAEQICCLLVTGLDHEIGLLTPFDVISQLLVDQVK